MVSQKIYVRILLLGIIFSLLHTLTADAKVGETRVSSVGTHPKSVKTKGPLRTKGHLSYTIIRPDPSMVDVVKLEGTPRQNISRDLETAEGIGQGAAHTQFQGTNMDSGSSKAALSVLPPPSPVGPLPDPSAGGGAASVGGVGSSGGGHTIQSAANQGSTMGAQVSGSMALSAGGGAPIAGGGHTIQSAANEGSTMGLQFAGSAAPSVGGAGTIDPAAGAGNVDPSAGGTPGYEEER